MNYGPERRNDNVDDFPLEETIGVDDHFENSNFEIDERPHPMDEVTDNIFPPLSPCQAKKSSNHYQSEVFFHERRSFLRREGKLKLENLKSKIKYRELKWAVLQDSRKKNVAIREDSSTDTSENE